MKQLTYKQKIKQIQNIINECFNTGDDEFGVEILLDIQNLIGNEEVDYVNSFHKELYKFMKGRTEEISAMLLLDELVLKEKIETQSLSPFEMSKYLEWMMKDVTGGGDTQ